MAAEPEKPKVPDIDPDTDPNEIAAQILRAKMGGQTDLIPALQEQLEYIKKLRSAPQIIHLPEMSTSTLPRGMQHGLVEMSLIGFRFTKAIRELL